MPLGKFQKGLRVREGLSLEQRQATPLSLWQPSPNGSKEDAAARADSVYEDAPAAMSFLNLATAASVFS
jgi:hypothetical protein